MMRWPDTPRATGCVSDLQLDRWRAGELAGEAARHVEEHVSSCEHCRARQARLDAIAADFSLKFPNPPRAKSRPPLARWLAAGSTVLAAAAAAALWLRAPADDGVRSKGTAHVGFFVKRGAQVVPGHDHDLVYPGDQLRFTLTTSRPQHVALLGRDGSGATFVYYPQGARSVSVGVVRDLPLDSSVELDATPGDEAFFAVFCDEAFDVAPLAVRLRPQPELPAPAGCTVDALHLRKASTP